MIFCKIRLRHSFVSLKDSSNWAFWVFFPFSKLRKLLKIFFFSWVLLTCVSHSILYGYSGFVGLPHRRLGINSWQSVAERELLTVLILRRLL